MPEILAEHLQTTVLAVPGVARLEPSVVGGLRRLLRSASMADGVQLVVVGDRLEATIDIAVAGRTAIETATEVEETVGALLRTGHPGPVAVTVRVLSVEAG